ncbi:MAG TPA: hypothetical protein VGD77_06765 [Gemmatimonadaceae bacterium]
MAVSRMYYRGLGARGAPWHSPAASATSPFSTTAVRRIRTDIDSPTSTTPQDRRDEISVHIFTVSATLIGACLTVVGVLRAVHRLQPINTWAEEILAVDAIGLLVACATAYSALRTDEARRRRRVERAADAVFLVALGTMVVACALFAWELI